MKDRILVVPYSESAVPIYFKGNLDTFSELIDKEMMAKLAETVNYGKLEKTLKDATKKLSSYKHLHYLFIRSTCDSNYYFDEAI